MYKVAAIQMTSIPGRVDENMDKGMRFFQEAVERGADFIVFPELWNTGYYLSREAFFKVAEPRDGRIVSLIRSIACEAKKVVVCPFAEAGDNSCFISVAVIDSDGTVAGFHRKSLLWGREKDIFGYGRWDSPVFETSVGKIGVVICYEAEFPEPCRMLALKGAELIVVPSVWSIGGADRWDIQLPARALDNLVFVLGVNSVGNNACGKSKLVDPYGKVVVEASGEREEVLVGTVDKKIIDRAREEIPYFKDFERRVTPIWASHLK